MALAAYALGDGLPSFAPFVAAAAPVPIALIIDMARGELGYWKKGQENPVSQLFMRFITVVALIIPFAIIAAQAANNLDLLILGLAILAGMIWVPHGWGADDPAGFIHFVLRAVLCYIAYLFTPEELRGAAVAGAAALTYVYAIIAMKKPSSVDKCVLSIFLTEPRSQRWFRLTNDSLKETVPLTGRRELFGSR